MGKLQGSILKNDREMMEKEQKQIREKERRMGGCVGCWGKERKIY